MNTEKTKLSLNKETISVLNQNEMDSAKGGFSSLICWGAITYGAYLLTEHVDVPSWGHDDGTWCPSVEAAICHGL